ncbi:MAG TPA: DUF4062 domain-containing protein, partial [Armatimonadota bacterium]|nr:DUF4062 domain-containing protein [Armatimonadota bacterium]
MAKPRVFISSTFYDQQHLRHELAAFVQGMGYEPVLSERGQIVYGPEKSPMESCFEEAGRCDILVSIIGGKLGSFSSEEPYTVAQQELKKAIQSHRPVYIFIYKAVFIEYLTYLVNKDG